MTSDHADFYLGTGPDARWLGSLAEFGPLGLSAVGSSAETDLTALFTAQDADAYAYEAAVVGLLAHRAAQGAFAVVPGPAGEPGWPWRAATSASWYACTFAHGRVQVSFRGGGPGPRPTSPMSRPGHNADLPVLADTTPTTARFTYTVLGRRIQITQTMRPVPQTYLDHRAETALAVARAAQLVGGPALASRRPRRRTLRRAQQPHLRHHPAHLRRTRRRAGPRRSPRRSPATRGRRADHRSNGLQPMGFTGSLILARTPTSLTDLAGHDAELIGHRDDGWQLTADHSGYPRDASVWVAALVDATNAPVLIAVVSDSDSALLVADSPGGHQWIARLNTLDSVISSDAVAAIADVAVAWVAEAGQIVDTELVREALCAADRDNRAADQAMLDAAGDIARMSEIVRNQISFIEVYVLRVLATLGLAVPVVDPGSWWAHLAHQAQTDCPG